MAISWDTYRLKYDRYSIYRCFYRYARKGPWFFYRYQLLHADTDTIPSYRSYRYHTDTDNNIILILYRVLVLIYQENFSQKIQFSKYITLYAIRLLMCQPMVVRFKSYQLPIVSVWYFMSNMSLTNKDILGCWTRKMVYFATIKYVISCVPAK